MFALSLFSTPLGDMLAVARASSLVFLDFMDDPQMAHRIQKITQKALAQIPTQETLPILRETEQQLREYFEGKRKTFSLPLDLEGTPFQKRAWNALLQIPYGETCSYLEEARSTGNLKAVRAIWGANNKNPIVIVIPCHRVIGSDGRLVGYGGGIDRKRWLLEHEKKYV